MDLVGPVESCENMRKLMDEEHDRVRPMANKFADALGQFEVSKAYWQPIFGDRLFRNFLAVKKAENEFYEGKSLEEEVGKLLTFY